MLAYMILTGSNHALHLYTKLVNPESMILGAHQSACDDGSTMGRISHGALQGYQRAGEEVAAQMALLGMVVIQILTRSTACSPTSTTCSQDGQAGIFGCQPSLLFSESPALAVVSELMDRWAISSIIR